MDRKSNSIGTTLKTNPLFVRVGLHTLASQGNAQIHPMTNAAASPAGLSNNWMEMGNAHPV